MTDCWPFVKFIKNFACLTFVLYGRLSTCKYHKFLPISYTVVATIANH